MQKKEKERKKDFKSWKNEHGKTPVPKRNRV